MRDDGTAYDEAEPRLDFGHVALTVLRKLPRIIVVTAVLCGLAYAVLLFMPKLYQSTANLLIEPRANVYTSATIEQAGATQYVVDDAQVASQIELIKSRTTMLAVIDTLDLRDVAEFAGEGGGLLSFLTGPPSAASLDERVIDALSDRVTVTRERDSRLITIAVRAEDPELAALIANTIAQAHIESRTRQQLTDTASATQWLLEEIERLRTSVSAAEAEVAEFRVANDLFTGPNNTSIPDQQLSTVSGQIAAAAERREAAQARAQLIGQMLANGESVLGLSDVQSSPIIQSLSQELARLQSLRAERLATLLPGHPDVRALDGQIGVLQGQIEAEARRVASAFQSQAQIESDLETSLRTELAEATTVASAATRQGVNLAELEREATAQRELLNAYLLRYTDAAARTQNGSALPDVRLVSEAAPSSRAAFPQTMLILVAVALMSIVVQVAAIIFSELLSGRAVRIVEAGYAVRVPREQSDAMPFAPLDGTPAPEPVPDAVAPDAAIIAAAADHEPQGWGVSRHATITAAPAIVASTLATAAQPPLEQEPTMLSITLSRVIAARNAVIAAMPPGYGVFSPDYLGHGYPVVAETEPSAETMPARTLATEPMLDEAAAPEPETAPETAEIVEAAPEEVEIVDAEPAIAAPVVEAPEAIVATDESPQVDVNADPVEAPVLRTDGPHTPRPPVSHLDREIERVATSMLDGNRVVVITATDGWQESLMVAERLEQRLLSVGLSVVEIDAASGAPGDEPGLSDLASGVADFGDVVHRSDHRAFSYVPWGRGNSIDRRSDRVPTLVAALADIHECVLVVTGRVGMASLLGTFTGIGADCLLVSGEGGITESALEDLSELGFADLHVVTLATAQSDVA